MAPESLEELDRVVHEPTREFVESTNVWEFMRTYDIDDYEALIRRTTTSVEGVEESGVEWFWDELVGYLGIDFFEDYDDVRDDSVTRRVSTPDGETVRYDGPQFTEWYPGGELNAAHNCVDRYAGRDAATRNRVALLWEGEPGEVRQVTYHDLRQESNRVANYLESVGVGTGDTVGLYMPMIPEVASIFYGCLKVGAIVVPVFSGFGVDATATRLADAGCSVLFTADGFYRRGEGVRLKDTADDAVQQAAEAGDSAVEHVVVCDRLGVADDPEASLTWTRRDEWWERAVASKSDGYETKSLPSEQASMLLYSSGTTGEPKGIVQTHAGALLQAAKEIHFGFDHKPGDRFFWVSDIGWMMGPWTLLGNHALGGTVFVYEGAPDHPQPDRLWELIDRHDLTVFGVSPTAIRAIRKHGEGWLAGHDRSSLRLLGSTGEPWDPENWLWFYENVGNGECPVINVSGGTEIMGCFLMPMPIQSLKPCTLGGPGLGMAVDVVDEDGGSVADTHERGYLVARDSCPSMTKSLWSGDERYIGEYWSRWDDLWNHGDWAQKDADGLWFLHGRADDTLNVAGRKVGPAEVEGAVMDHPAVNQAAAVGVPDNTTGTAVVCYVVPEPDREPSDGLREAINSTVGDELGKPFRPREVLFVDALPKTQSGKILRRAIGSVYRGEELGDMSSIENPDALKAIEDAT